MAQDGEKRIRNRRKYWIVPIPGTTKLHRLEENLGAAAVELTTNDMREIENAASKITIQGARYPENLERMSNRCARSAWHTHPLGQILIVTAGTGWVQQWGGEKQEIRSGDVVWTPPGVKHWHGTSATDRLTHIAIQEALDGKVVEWMEKVSDEQYRGRK